MNLVRSRPQRPWVRDRAAIIFENRAGAPRVATKGFAQLFNQAVDIHALMHDVRGRPDSEKVHRHERSRQIHVLHPNSDRRMRAGRLPRKPSRKARATFVCGPVAPLHRWTDTSCSGSKRERPAMPPPIMMTFFGAAPTVLSGTRASETPASVSALRLINVRRFIDIVQAMVDFFCFGEGRSLSSLE